MEPLWTVFQCCWPVGSGVVDLVFGSLFLPGQLGGLIQYKRLETLPRLHAACRAKISRVFYQRTFEYEAVSIELAWTSIVSEKRVRAELTTQTLSIENKLLISISVGFMYFDRVLTGRISTPSVRRFGATVHKCCAWTWTHLQIFGGKHPEAIIINMLNYLDDVNINF